MQLAAIPAKAHAQRDEAPPKSLKLYPYGLSQERLEQAAKTLGISTSTAKSDWAYAKSWLLADMAEHPRNG